MTIIPHAPLWFQKPRVPAHLQNVWNGEASRLSSVPKRRQIIVVTLRKWQSQYESYHQSLSWLQCDMDQKSHGGVSSAWNTRRTFRSPNNSTELNWITNFRNQKTSGMREARYILWPRILSMQNPMQCPHLQWQPDLPGQTVIVVNQLIIFVM